MTEETFMFMQFVLRQNEAVESHPRIPVLAQGVAQPPSYTWLVHFPREPFSDGDQQHHNGLDVVFPVKKKKTNQK